MTEEFISSFLPQDYRVDWVGEQQFHRSAIKEAGNEDYGIQPRE
jgi:hypothetical protein